MQVLKGSEVSSDMGLIDEDEEFVHHDHDVGDCGHCDNRLQESYAVLEDGFAGVKYCSIFCLEATREMARQLGKAN